MAMLRNEFSLINSKFNDFLYAPVGEEGNGMTLNVFSAFSRLDIDPWQESARLSDLSKEKAVEALAPVIARLSDARWALADTKAIATRLVAFLPRRETVRPARATTTAGLAKPSPRTILLLIFLAVSAVFFTAAARHQAPQSGAEVPTASAAPKSQAQVPISGSRQPD